MRGVMGAHGRAHARASRAGPPQPPMRDLGVTLLLGGLAACLRAAADEPAATRTVWLSGRDTTVSAAPPEWDPKGYVLAFACQVRSPRLACLRHHSSGSILSCTELLVRRAGSETRWTTCSARF